MTIDELKISNFDAAEYLRDEESIAAFLNASAETGDPAVLLNALSTVARARSMTELAQASGLGRESLYKALKPGAQPRYDTVMKVITALGVQITFQAPGHATRVSTAKKAPADRVKASPAVKVPARQPKARKHTTGRDARAAAKSEPHASGKPRLRK